MKRNTNSKMQMVSKRRKKISPASLAVSELYIKTLKITLNLIRMESLNKQTESNTSEDMDKGNIYSLLL